MNTQEFKLGKMKVDGLSEKNLCIVLTDTSASVTDFIDEIQEGCNGLKERIENDATLKNVTDIAILSYDDDVVMVRNFDENAPITELTAKGCTHYYEATLKAANILAKAISESQKQGIRVKAELINLTDGYATDEENKDEALDALKYLQSKGVFTMSLAVDGADMDGLKNDYKNVYLINNTDDIAEAFKMFGYQSLLTFSKSKFGTKGKMLEGTALETEVESGVSNMNDADDYFNKFTKI